MSGEDVFKIAMGHVFKWEGGLVDDPRDPGGLTKYGISMKAYPHLGREGIMALTKEDAAALYKKDYWSAIPEWMYDTHPGTCVVMFDCAVNQGCGFAKRALQRACSAAADGVIGADTKRRVLAMSDAALIDALCVERALHYAGLGTFKHFGRGWMRRLFDAHSTGRTLSE